jgi:antirestriction protein
MSGESSAEYIERHASGDFGEITEEEIFQNQKVINKKVKEVGDMVFSSYSLAFD